MATSVPIPRGRSRRRRLYDWADGVLYRIGHVWFENPLTLVTFVGRLVVAAVAGRVAGLHPRRMWVPLWRLVKQFLRTLVRGMVLVAVLGLTGGLAVGIVARAAGTFFRPLFDGSSVC